MQTDFHILVRARERKIVVMNDSTDSGFVNSTYMRNENKIQNGCSHFPGFSHNFLVLTGSCCLREIFTFLDDNYKNSN